MNHFEAADGRRLAYRDEGAGPPVLCLAGLTRDSRDFHGLAAHLAPRHRVIRLDSRGRGESERAENPFAEYQAPVEAADALALLDHLGIPRATVIGTSRGGILAMLIGATARERLAGVVFNDVGPVIEDAGIAAIMSYLGVQPQFGTFDDAAEGMAAALGRYFPDLAPQDWLAFARDLYHEEDGRPVLSYDPALRGAVMAAMSEAPPDLWDLFDTLDGVPMLTIRGGLSNVFSADTLAEMVRRRPDMAHVTLANRGHVPFLTEPEALAAIDAFLAEHAA